MNFTLKILQLLTFLITATILTVLLFNKQIPSINYNDYLTYAGVFITCLSFLAGTYFIVLAISAYSHVRNIEIIQTKSEDLFNRNVEQFNYLKNQSKIYFSESSESIIDIIGYQIFHFDSAFPEKMKKEMKGEFSKMKQDLLHLRSRVAMSSIYLNDKKRMNLIREIIEVGDEIDLKKLKEISKCEFETEVIKKFSDSIYNLLYIKLHNY